MFEVSICDRFSAAHRLVGYRGSCSAVHGHNWEVSVFIRGPELDDTGILVDFRALKNALGGALEELDHADLNDVSAFADRNPTSENIAKYVFDRVKAVLDVPGAFVHRVCVKETPGSEACYWEDDGVVG